MCARLPKLIFAYLLALTLCIWLSAAAIAAPVADLTPTAEPPTPTAEVPTNTPEPTLTPVPPTETPVVAPTNTLPPPTPTVVVVDNSDDDGEADPAPVATLEPMPTATNTPEPTPSTMPVTGGSSGADGLIAVAGLLFTLALLVAVGRFYERHRASGQ